MAGLRFAYRQPRTSDRTITERLLGPNQDADGASGRTLGQRQRRGCMADALNGAQFEILRRVRDGVELTAPPFIPAMINELRFLRAFRLVEFRNTFDVKLTPLGSAYLAEADRAAGLEPQPAG